MKVVFIKRITPYMAEYKALESGVITTSAGDHPGPRDVSLFIKGGEGFQLRDEYLEKNVFTIISDSKRGVS